MTKKKGFLQKKFNFLKQMAEMNRQQRDGLLISGYIRNNCNAFIIDGIHDIIFMFYFCKIDSNILNDNETEILLDMITKHRNIESEWKLIYRASIHGGKRNIFFDRLKNQKPSLHIIETTDGDVFGGFTSIFMPNPDDNYKSFADNKAFLYTLRASNPDFMDRIKPQIFPIKSNLSGYAIGARSDLFLMFGIDDIFLTDGIFNGSGIMSYGGNTYAMPSNKFYLTCGNEIIQIKDIESFILIDP